MKVFFLPENYDRYMRYEATDHKKWIAGGPSFSSGDMSVEVVIQQSKSDKRFKGGKRYVEVSRIPGIIRGTGYPRFPPIDLSGFVEVDIGE